MNKRAVVDSGPLVAIVRAQERSRELRRYAQNPALAAFHLLAGHHRGGLALAMRTGSD